MTGRGDAPADRAAGGRSHEAWRRILSGVRLPAAVVDLDAFDRNVELVAARAASAGRRVRIATKSLRVPTLIERVIARGDPFTGLMCFSPHEAEALAGRGLDDLFVAYPVQPGAGLDAVRRVHDSGVRISIAVDDADGLVRADDAMRGSQSEPLDIVLDVDASLRPLGGRLHLGVRRSPVHGAAAVTELLHRAASLDHVRVIGAMTYDAQVAGLGDANPFDRVRTPGVRAVRAASMRRVTALRAQVAAAFAGAGVPLVLANGGGSGSLEHALADPSLTEVTVGSGLYCPHLFDYYRRESIYEPASWIALPVVRTPAPGIVTCFGGGYAASGAAGPDRLPRPVSPVGCSTLAAEGCGEVQTPVRLPRGIDLAAGDPVIFRTAKSGEPLERFDRVSLVASNEIVKDVATYRGEGWTFG